MKNKSSNSICNDGRDNRNKSVTAQQTTKQRSKYKLYVEYEARHQRKTKKPHNRIIGARLSRCLHIVYVNYVPILFWSAFIICSFPVHSAASTLQYLTISLSQRARFPGC
jgi:hypothetical protein